MAIFASFIVIALVFSSNVGADRTSTVIPEAFDVESDNLASNTSCDDVRQVYVDRNIGSAKDTSDMSHEGT